MLDYSRCSSCGIFQNAHCFWNSRLDGVNGFYAASWPEVEPHKCSPDFAAKASNKSPRSRDAIRASFVCVDY